MLIFGTGTPSQQAVEDYIDSFSGGNPPKATNQTHTALSYSNNPFPQFGNNGPAGSSQLVHDTPQSLHQQRDNLTIRFLLRPASLGLPLHNGSGPSFWSAPKWAKKPPASKKSMGKMKYYGDDEDEPEEDIEADYSAEDAEDKETWDNHEATTPLFPAVVPNADEKEDDMEVDMEHPDVEETDNEDDRDPGEEAEPENGDTSTVKPATTEIEPVPEVSQAPTATGVDEEVWGNGKAIVDSNIEEKASTEEKLPATEDTMQNYIRSKHGFRVENLALHLIPLKASVLGRALDLSYLRHLALLNVGSQAAFWTLLDKLKGEGVTLQLQSIHTDDVTISFLNCAAGLTGLTDLFLMKRSTKESSVLSKNAASITDIHDILLQKHITTLKRLMIMSTNYNYDDTTWDLDVKTIRLVALKGFQLMELAICVALDDYVSPKFNHMFSTDEFKHVLMQALPGLKNLIALHIITLRNNDTCAAVIRECRKFTIDNISHHPNLRIKYLAIQSTVYQLVRRDPATLPNPLGGQSKGKGKAVADEKSRALDQHAETSVLENSLNKSGLELGHEKVPSRFWEVQGVKIFEKSIRLGKL